MPLRLGGICNKECPECTTNIEPAFGNTYSSIDLSSPIHDEALEFRSYILLNKAIPSQIFETTQKITTSTEIAQDKSSIATVDPVCTPNFCNYHGKCRLIYKYLACECDEGYNGSNCHLVNNDYFFLKGELSNNFTKFKLELVWGLLTNKNNYTEIGMPSERNMTAMFNLIETASYIYSNTDNEFFNTKNIELSSSSAVDSLINYVIFIILLPSS